MIAVVPVGMSIADWLAFSKAVVTVSPCWASRVVPGDSRTLIAVFTSRQKSALAAPVAAGLFVFAAGVAVTAPVMLALAVDALAVVVLGVGDAGWLLG